MKVAVVGCGAVGSFYGAKLWRAGHRVHFLLRSDYDAVRQHGVQIRSVDGDFCARPIPARTPDDIGPSDLVLVALKTTANSLFPRIIPPLLHPQSQLLTLQNGLGNEAALAALANPERVRGAMCFVCLNRIAPGVIHHLAHGAIVLGEYLHPPSADTQALAELFRSAGVPCTLAANLEQAHWEKLVWNIPFNGLGVAGIVGVDSMTANPVAVPPARTQTLATDELLADPAWERWLRALMQEVIATARALGFPLSPALADQMIERTRCMGAYKASTLLDFEHGLPLELRSLFLEPARQARQAGVPTPHLDALCRVLTALDHWAAPSDRL